MGMFDTVYCKYPLPDARDQDLEFQTKDLECLLDTYTIAEDGRLRRRVWRRQPGPDHDVDWPFHGDIHIYTRDPSRDTARIEYVVRFTQDRVEWIRPLEEVPPPQLPLPEDEPPWELSGLIEPLAKRRNLATEQLQPAEAGREPAPDAEAALLESLRRDRQELEKLLGECNGHWGYEDSVYRFYHQSFKVYGLQARTTAIVNRLKALAPERALDPWFVQIIEAGTGKTFKTEDNARWAETTRPIVEAFFHARFFLEMAVRYGNLSSPPQPMPSGYAALLCLFGLR
jgi:hypothetical protein